MEGDPKHNGGTSPTSRWLPDPNALVGERIGDRYELQNVVGTGGTSAVFAARHVLTGQAVAVKVLLPRSLDSSLPVERFLREARLAAGLEHPNVVGIRDMGLEDEMPFLVMSLLEGQSLGAAVREAGSLPASRALQWLLPIMGALACAHDRGVLHRDLKPENIFLSDEPDGIVPKLLDFGLAKRHDAETVTRSGTVVGTPAFMSPEQAQDEELTPAADVWSMGVVWFWCLTGKLPFHGTSLTDVLIKVVSSSAPALAEYPANVPRPLAAAVSKALERSLDSRYSSMREFAWALAVAAQAAGVALPDNPDSRGLADWSQWLSGMPATATISVEQPSPLELVRAAQAAEQRTGSTDDAGQQDAPQQTGAFSKAEQQALASTTSAEAAVRGEAGRGAAPRWVWAALLAVLALGGGGLWLRVDAVPADVEVVPESTKAVVDAPVAAPPPVVNRALPDIPPAPAPPMPALPAVSAAAPADTAKQAADAGTAAGPEKPAGPAKASKSSPKRKSRKSRKPKTARRKSAGGKAADDDVLDMIPW